MKKLLSILGAAAIVSSTASVTACQFSNLVKSSIETKIRNYINISSLLARGTVLSQEDGIDGGQGLALNAVSSYLYPQTLGEYFNFNQMPESSLNQTNREMMGSMFDFGSSDSDVYTVRNNVGGKPTQFTTNLKLQADDNTGKKSTDDTMSIISLVSGAISAYFGSDFNSGLAPGLNELLGAVAGQLVGTIAGSDGQGALVNTINGFLRLKNTQEATDQDPYIFENFADSFKEDDIANIQTASFNDVFSQRAAYIWTGLAQILYSGLDNPNGQDWTTFINDIKSKNDQHTKDSIKEAAELAFYSKDVKVAFNSRLINGVIDILKYLRTFLNYYQYVINQKAIPLKDLPSDSDYNHVFSSDQSNGIFISKVLQENYINENNVVDSKLEPTTKTWDWIKDGDSYYQVLDLDTILTMLKSLLSYDKTNDPHGYGMGRFLSLALSFPLKEEVDNQPDTNRDDLAFTPIYDGIVEPLLAAVINNKLINLPDLVGKNVYKLLGSIRVSFGDSTPAWSKGFGSNFSLSGVLSLVGLVPGSVGDMAKSLNNSIKVEQDNPNPSLFKQNWGNPIWGIYGNNLLPIILKSLNGLINIPSNITNNFTNLKTVLTMRLGDILSLFGLNISTLPIYLYDLKNISLTEIINSFANEFEAKRSNTTNTNHQPFLINCESLMMIMESLNSKISIEFGEKTPDPVTNSKLLDENGQMNVVMATLITLGYPTDIKNMLGPDKQPIYSSQSWLTYAIGIRITDGEYGQQFTFAPSSILGSLANLYGHDTTFSQSVASMNILSMQVLVSSLTSLTAWMNNSQAVYTNDFFKPYFDARHWSTSLISTRSLEDRTTFAYITYDLIYQPPGVNQKLTYRVKLTRGESPSPNWDNFGKWMIESITSLQEGAL